MTITVPGREGKYTKSDEKILEFMESHTDEFLFMSIGEVAKRLEVSEATISRAARHLGYRDFKEMKNEIIGQKTGKGAAGKIAGTLLKTQGFDIGKWFAMQQECLSSTLENFDQKEFSGQFPRSRAPGIFISMGKMLRLPLPSFFSSACGDWGIKYLWCPREAQKSSKGSSMREKETW